MLYIKHNRNLSTMKKDIFNGKISTESKKMVKFALIKSNSQQTQDDALSISVNSLVLPQVSTAEMREKLLLLNKRIDEINENIESIACYVNGIKQAIKQTNSQS